MAVNKVLVRFYIEKTSEIPTTPPHLAHWINTISVFPSPILTLLLSNWVPPHFMHVDLAITENLSYHVAISEAPVLPKGLYIVKLTSGNSVKTCRIILQ